MPLCEVVRLKADDGDARYNLSLTLAVQGRHDEAGLNIVRFCGRPRTTPWRTRTSMRRWRPLAESTR